MRYKWKLERYGIECVVVRDGLDERNQLCLGPPVKCWIKEFALGKPVVLTMWRE